MGKSGFSKLEDDNDGLDYRPSVGVVVGVTLLLVVALPIVVVLSPLLCLLVPLIKRKRAAKRANTLRPSAQTNHPQPRVAASSPPGKGAPLFHGVRVLEVATYVAAPTVGKCMADLGAEVVKVEEPNGDAWRYTLLEYDQTPEPRAFSSLFEITNFGKVGVQLDLKKADDMAVFKTLLADADVLVSNVRIDSLKRLRLDYHSIKDEFPHLVVAHLSAWGLEGDDYGLAGYDVGGFWTGTGLSASINAPPTFSAYPAGFGDLATGQAVLGGVSLALMHRLHTGRGQLVTSALLRAGTWCVTPALLKADGPGPDVPDYLAQDRDHPAYTTYVSSDGQGFALHGLDHAGKHAASLKAHFRIVCDTDQQLMDALTQRFSEQGMDSIEGLLVSLGIAFSKAVSFQDAGQSQSDLVTNVARCFEPPVQGLTDLVRIPRLPYDLNCSAHHGSRHRAPAKGEHTTSFLASRWSERCAEAAFPSKPQPNAPADNARPLEGLVVVELSEADSTVSAACCMLADHGATVVKVEPPQGDAWRASFPKLFKQLNRGKRSVVLDLETGDGRAALSRLLANASAFVTNWPVDALARVGFSHDKCLRDKPNLVYSLVTPYGEKGPCDRRGALGAAYVECGMGALIGGTNAPVKRVPTQCLEMLSSCYVFASTSAALFHLRRTNEGQLVDTVLMRVGYWSSQVWTTLCVKVPANFQVMSVEPKRYYARFPVPTFMAHRTKDGRWVQLLGVDLPRHLGPTLKSLGIAGPTYFKLVFTVLYSVLPNRKAPSRLVQVFPIFALLNHTLRDAVAKLTYAEAVATFTKHNVWHCPVRMPRQMLGYKQAWDIELFGHDADRDVFVASPVVLSASRKDAHFPAAPALDDHAALVHP